MIGLLKSEEVEELLSGLDFDRADPLFGLDPEDPRLQELCANCSYPPDGCDFRNPDGDPDCAPCGALVAAAGLIVSGWRVP